MNDPSLKNIEKQLKQMGDTSPLIEESDIKKILNDEQTGVNKPSIVAFSLFDLILSWLAPLFLNIRTKHILKAKSPKGFDHGK